MTKELELVFASATDNQLEDLRRDLNKTFHRLNGVPETKKNYPVLLGLEEHLTFVTTEIKTRRNK